MKKILIVSQELPFPLSTGGQVSIYSRLRGLSENYEVDLCAVNLESIQNRQTEIKNTFSFLNNFFLFEREIPEVWGKSKKLKSLYCFFINLFFEKIPRGASIVRNKLLYNFLVANCKNYDLILFENYNSFNHFFNLAKEEVIHSRTKIALVTHNIEAHLAFENYKLRKNFLLKFYFLLEAIKIKYYENKVYKFSPKTICISYKDYDTLRKSYVGNFVYIPQHLRLIKYKWKFNNSKKVIFNANLDFSPNMDGLIWYLDNIHQIIIKDQPEYKLFLTGNVSKKNINILNKYSHLNFTGFLMEDEFYKLFLSCDLMINPVSKGSGIKIKLLDALSIGIPIVSTKHGAEGIDRDLGIKIVDESNLFADYVILGLKNIIGNRSFDAVDYNKSINMNYQKVFFYE